MIKFPITIWGENLFKAQELGDDVVEKLSDILAKNNKGKGNFSDFIKNFESQTDEFVGKTLSKTIEKIYGNGKKELTSADKPVKYTGIKKKSTS